MAYYIHKAYELLKKRLKPGGTNLPPEKGAENLDTWRHLLNSLRVEAGEASTHREEVGWLPWFHPFTYLTSSESLSKLMKVPMASLNSLVSVFYE